MFVARPVMLVSRNCGSNTGLVSSLQLLHWARGSAIQEKTITAHTWSHDGVTVTETHV